MRWVIVGITIVGKATHIPPGWTVGANCIIGTDLRLKDFEPFTNCHVPDGTWLGYDTKKK
ncbi:MAG UNVERIFIED_CONTAM: hypothetical protein LVT10_04855 [Anaerolineae bacterium]|jgi:NDP-sugar pyrophosphorylase family protein